VSSKQAPPSQAPLYAVSAEFASPDAVLAAARALSGQNLGRLDIHSPVPLDGAMDALGLAPRPIPQMMAVGAVVVGFAAMMGMCIYATAYDYVFNIGGRPLISWPAFMVPSVSFATLLGAAAVFLNMTFLNRLPLLNHPAFNIPNFERATQDRFFLTVEPRHDAFDPMAVEKALARLALRAVAVHRVPR
jgi:hypothetical protein